MMKLLLGLSLVGNAVLIGLLLKRTPEEAPKLERVVIETPASKVVVEPPVSKNLPVSEPEKVRRKQLEDAGAVFGSTDHQEFQDEVEKLEESKQRFLTEELGLTPEKLENQARLREEYLKEVSQFWKKNPMGELSFQEKRKMVDLEENYYKKLEKLYGKKNWERYQNFRDKYNQRGFKRQQEENRPFLFMSL